MTDAHTQTQHFTLLESFPAHEPRKGDPHYAAFNAAQRVLQKAGKLVCWISNADCQGTIELHHNLVEFALANIVDEAHFAQFYPEFNITDEESFLAWCETQANLLPLCVMHHRGVLGIHTIHFPAWQVQREMKAGIAPPEKKVSG